MYFVTYKYQYKFINMSCLIVAHSSLDCNSAKLLDKFIDPLMLKDQEDAALIDDTDKM